MDFDSRIPMSRPADVSPSLDEDTLWQLNLRSMEAMESGPYPVREGEPDCSYYIRTGLCRFGATCRFNHPPNRKLAIATAKMRGEYPERVGQPDCQYYLKTGTCKFGATCKFHHPRDMAGVEGRVSLNVLGYPLRPNKPGCAYYLRTGQCKFGNTCTFHHPNMMDTVSGSPLYRTAQLPARPGQQSYPSGMANLPLALSTASFVPSPRPSNYGQIIRPQRVLSVPKWNPYSASLVPLSSPISQQAIGNNNQLYGNLRKNAIATEQPGGTYSSYHALQRENLFPERHGEPDCQFYMKTGDCMFGAVCRFHHPRERLIPTPDYLLSPIGLPLRPGEPLCIFYSRYGMCKFGPRCKFDHPMGVLT